jgi:hypothetical protein
VEGGGEGMRLRVKGGGRGWGDFCS